MKQHACEKSMGKEMNGKLKKNILKQKLKNNIPKPMGWSKSHSKKELYKWEIPTLREKRDIK